eukprot:3145824-Prymnesium_polylepis.1
MVCLLRAGASSCGARVGARRRQCRSDAWVATLHAAASVALSRAPRAVWRAACRASCPPPGAC